MKKQETIFSYIYEDGKYRPINFTFQRKETNSLIKSESDYYKEEKKLSKPFLQNQKKQIAVVGVCCSYFLMRFLCQVFFNI